jgi:hypothetical protein
VLISTSRPIDHCGYGFIGGHRAGIHLLRDITQIDLGITKAGNSRIQQNVFVIIPPFQIPIWFG